MKKLLQVGWSWHPSVVIGLLLATLLYIRQVRKVQSVPLKQLIFFHLGTSIMFLALVSPLDKLGDNYLFSAHMVQHLLLMFVVAPLWLIGFPGQVLGKLLTPSLEEKVSRLVSPVSGLLLFVGAMAFWHIPAIYAIAQENESAHIFEHLTFILSALVGWWPVVGAETNHLHKPVPPLQMLYLFLLALSCTAIAAILTLAGKPFYNFYLQAPHLFGLNPLQDQHLGGLLMWLPTHMILLLAFSLIFLKWLEQSGRYQEPDFR